MWIVLIHCEVDFGVGHNVTNEYVVDIGGRLEYHWGGLQACIVIGWGLLTLCFCGSQLLYHC